MPAQPASPRPATSATSTTSGTDEDLPARAPFGERTEPFVDERVERDARPGGDRRDVAVGEQRERRGYVGVAHVCDGREDVDLPQDRRREVELARRAVQADEQNAA